MKTASEIANRRFLIETTRIDVTKEIQEYARQCCEDALNRAAENVNTSDKESITSTEIILP